MKANNNWERGGTLLMFGGFLGLAAIKAATYLLSHLGA